jgi:hypothetical protein
MRPVLWRPVSPPGTNDRFLLRPPAPPPHATLERTRFGFTERPGSSHRPLAKRSHLPCTRRWRNDPRRLSSYRTHCLPPQIDVAFQLHRPRTLSSTGQSLALCRPFDVQAFRPRTVRLGRWCDPAPLRPKPAPLTRESQGATPNRLSPPSPVSCWGSASNVRVSGSLVCDRLARPFPTCLATVRGARARCVPTDFCFPLLRLRVLAPLVFPASFRDLRLAPPP